MRNGFLRAVEGEQGVGQVLMRVDVIRLKGKGGLVVGERQLRAVQCGQDHARQGPVAV